MATDQEYKYEEISVTLPGFINLTDSDAVIKVDTEDYEIEQYPGKWRSVDYLIFEGKSYFLMENQKYGKDAAALVLNQYGKVILDECKDGFDQDTIDRMKSAVQKFNEQENRRELPKNGFRYGRNTLSMGNTFDLQKWQRNRITI